MMSSPGGGAHPSVVLAMDTSGPSLSVALVREGQTVFECVQQNGHTHSESLMPLVDQALRAGNIRPADVDLFAVTTGPGSFTGVRIGVATAKALSQATGKPVAGVNALLALAQNAWVFPGIVCAPEEGISGEIPSWRPILRISAAIEEGFPCGTPPRRPIFQISAAVQDARAGQVYAAAFGVLAGDVDGTSQGRDACVPAPDDLPDFAKNAGRHPAPRMSQILPDEALPLEAFLEKVKPFLSGARCCFVGDGALRHRDAILAYLGGNAAFVPPDLSAIRASHVARLAVQDPASHGDWRALLPYYLRAPQAERERAARLAAEKGAGEAADTTPEAGKR